jgi:hypothetical protein
MGLAVTATGPDRGWILVSCPYAIQEENVE